MKSAVFAGALSYHARDRVFERTRLTPIEVQRMLDRREYCWADGEGRRRTQGPVRYAVVFDTIAGDFVVAVVLEGNHVVKTVLTLEQFEKSEFPVSDAVKLLARLALLPAEALPQIGLAQRGVGVTDTTSIWRFMVKDVHRSLYRMSLLTQAKVAEFAGAFEPVVHKKATLREGRRVVATAGFTRWLAGQLDERNIEAESVRELWLESVSPDSLKCAFAVDLTSSFIRALSSPARIVIDRASAPRKEPEPSAETGA